MPVEQRYPTIEDLLHYEEFLLDAVEKQVAVEENPRARAILKSLQVLLMSRAVKSFIDLLSQKNSLYLVFIRYKRLMMHWMNYVL